MANSFKALEALNDRMVLNSYDELVRHAPMKSGVADTTRPVADIRGVLHTPNPAGTINIGNGLTTTFTAAEAALVINRADYPTLVVKALDKIRGMICRGSPGGKSRT